jgi:hypothetical protein
MSHMIYRGVRYGVEYIDKGAETFEKRLREKAVRTVKFLIKSQNIKGMELAAVLGAN